MDEDGQVKRGFTNTPRDKQVATSLLSTNRQIYQEAQRVLIGESFWTLWNPIMTSFPAIIGPRFSLIQNLHLDFRICTKFLTQASPRFDYHFYIPEMEDAMGLINRMPALKQLRLTGRWQPYIQDAERVRRRNNVEAIYAASFNTDGPNNYEYWLQRLLTLAVRIISADNHLETVVILPRHWPNPGLRIMPPQIPVRLVGYVCMTGMVYFLHEEDVALVELDRTC